MKFGKREKAKIKKQHVRRPLLTSVGFLKRLLLQIFWKYSQSYVNFQIELPLKSRQVVLVFSIWM